MKKLFSILILFSLISLGINLVGCGGGGGGDNVKEGVFLDSAVKGLNYETATQKGITDSNGKFTYKEGELITFSISPSIILGQTVAKSRITPIELVGGAADINNSHVINICRFIQTLDDDGDVNNGINITESVRNAANGLHINFNVDTSQFENEADQVMTTLTSLTSGGLRNLVSINTAQDHFNQIFQRDNDGDGFTVSEGDCNDNDATVYPNAPEISCDGIDQDCDGGDYCEIDPNDMDNDGDGFSVNQGDCDDNSNSVYPGAPEIQCDGIDQDCNGNDYCANGSDDCEVVINPQGPGFLKVVNNTNGYIHVMLPEYAFGACVRPKVCELYGLDVGSREVEISQCSDDECDNCNWTSTEEKTIYIQNGDTHEIIVNENFFSE